MNKLLMNGLIIATLLTGTAATAKEVTTSPYTCKANWNYHWVLMRVTPKGIRQIPGSTSSADRTCKVVDIDTDYHDGHYYFTGTVIDPLTHVKWLNVSVKTDQ